jgi:hypothetical protein
MRLKHVRIFNEEVFGTKNNPYSGWVCLNENCKGWFCNYCDEYHPYGTICSVALVRNGRDRFHKWKWHG